MNFLIIGAGAIGCLVGGKLALQGDHNITLVGRPKFAQQVKNQNGLVLIESDQRQQIDNITAVESIESAKNEVKDLSEYVAIVTVKGYDTEEVCKELIDANMKPTWLLSLQNGVGNEKILAENFGKKRVIAGAITTPVTVEEPAVIKVERDRYAIGISPLLSDDETRPVVKNIAEALRASNFKTSIYPDARDLKWTKLLMNMLGNASSAILDQLPDKTFRQNCIVSLEIDAMREALHVMKAEGIQPINFGGYNFNVLAPLIQRVPKWVLIPILRKQLLGARGSKEPTLLTDIRNKKTRSQVEQLNGAVVEMGSNDISTYVNKVLLDTLMNLVMDQRKRDDWRGDYKKLAESCGKTKLESSQQQTKIGEVQTI